MKRKANKSTVEKIDLTTDLDKKSKTLGKKRKTKRTVTVREKLTKEIVDNSKLEAGDAKSKETSNPDKTYKCVIANYYVTPGNLRTVDSLYHIMGKSSNEPKKANNLDNTCSCWLRNDKETLKSKHSVGIHKDSKIKVLLEPRKVTVKPESKLGLEARKKHKKRRDLNKPRNINLKLGIPEVEKNISRLVKLMKKQRKVINED